MEQGSSRRSGRLRKTRVFNIETESGNYYADGLLVHNCHRIKAPGGKASRFAHLVAKTSKRQIGLTGTPMPNNPLDIYAQARALDTSVFGTSFTAFRGRYAITHPDFKNQVLRWINMDEFERKYRQLAITIDPDLSLPPETEQTIDVELPPKALKSYAQMEREFITWLESGEEVSASNVLVKMLRLQQMTAGHIKTDDGKVVDVHSAKEDALADILTDIGERVVVFARFTADLRAVERVAKKLGRAYGEISGSRKDLTDHATMPDGVEIMGVQVQSGSAGIDLTAASVGVFFTLTHSLGDYTQCRGRLYRPKQKRHVHWFHLVAAGTIDEKILKALEKKQEVIDAIMSGAHL